MTKHNFDFENALTVKAFFKAYKVKPADQQFCVKMCNGSESRFPAVGFATGELTEDGRPAYRWFCPSKAVAESEDIETKEDLKDFLRKHKEDLMLLEPPSEEDEFEDTEILKFGICFLAGSSENWNDEW